MGSGVTLGVNFSGRQILAVWIFAAKLPDSDLNFGGGIFGWIFSSTFSQGKSPPKSPTKFTQSFGRKNSPRTFLQKPFLGVNFRSLWGWSAGVTFESLLGHLSSFSDLFSRVLFSFLPFLLVTPLPLLVSAPFRPFLLLEKCSVL